MVKLKLKEELTLKGTQTIELLLEKRKVQLEPDRCGHDLRTWQGTGAMGRDGMLPSCIVTHLFWIKGTFQTSSSHMATPGLTHSPMPVA